MDIHKFLEVERKYALYSQNIEGIHYWNYSRVQIWNYEICAQKLDLREPHRTKRAKFKEGIRDALALIKNCIWRGKLVSQPDILFLAHERRTKCNGMYQCIYTQPLAELFPHSITLDKPYEYRHQKPESGVDRYYIDYILFCGRLHYQIHKFLNTKHYRSTLARLREQMEKPLREIMDNYEVRIAEKELYGILHKSLLMVERELKLYEKLLRKIQPKLIVEVVYYGTQGMLLNELAKKQGVPTVELQHGTMHGQHAAYQINWDDTIPQLPDQIFLFSEFWKKQIHVPLADSSLTVTGFPYFEQNRQNYTGGRIREKKTVLFVSQGTVGDRLSRLAVEAAEQLLPRGYRILYKLHPAEVCSWESAYPYLKNTGIEVQTGKNKSIYECFAESDAQVGVYSTAIYEGLGFGLRTFIYNIGHADTLYELAREGYAQMINDSGELVRCLEEDTPPKKGDLFWSDNAISKMENELKKLLEKDNR